MGRKQVKNQLIYLNNMDISYSDLNLWLQIPAWENKRPTSKVKYLEIPVPLHTNYFLFYQEKKKKKKSVSALPRHHVTAAAFLSSLLFYSFLEKKFQWPEMAELW